jgi:hypothetical protein
VLDCRDEDNSAEACKQEADKYTDKILDTKTKGERDRAKDDGAALAAGKKREDCKDANNADATCDAESKADFDKARESRDNKPKPESGGEKKARCEKGASTLATKEGLAAKKEKRSVTNDAKQVQDAGRTARDEAAKKAGAGDRAGQAAHMKTCSRAIAESFKPAHEKCTAEGKCKAIEEEKDHADHDHDHDRRLKGHVAAPLDAKSAELLTEVKKKVGGCTDNDQGCCPTDFDDEEVENMVRNHGKRVKETKTNKVVGKFCFTGVTKKNVEDGKAKFTEGVQKAAETAAGDAKKVSAVQCDAPNEEGDGNVEVCIKCQAKCTDEDCAEKVKTAAQDKTNKEIIAKLPTDGNARGRKLATATLTSAEGARTTTSVTVDDDAPPPPAPKTPASGTGAGDLSAASSTGVSMAVLCATLMATLRAM